MLKGKGLKGGISLELGLRPPRRGGGKADKDGFNICNLGKSICLFGQIYLRKGC